MFRPALALAMVLAAPAAAQDEDPFTAAEELVGSVAMQAAIAGLLSPATVAAAIDATVPVGTEQDIEVLADVIAGELTVARVGLELALTEAAAETFTTEELQALTEFYGSDTGAAIAAKTEAFVAAAMQLAEPEIEAATQRIEDRLDALAQ